MLICKILLILIIILILITPLIIIFNDSAFVLYFTGKKPDIKLSYENFIKYYNLHPQRYSHYSKSRYAGYIQEEYKHLFCYTWIDKHYQYNNILIGFNNIFDMIKANWYVKNYVKNEEKMANAKIANEKLKKYLTLVQKDINNLLDTSEEQINEAKEITNNITENKMTDKKYLDCANASLPYAQSNIGAATASATID